MIRQLYIKKQILNIYSMLPKIEFPINPREIIQLLPNCRYMSYQTFAELNHCGIDDVIQICESISGCTHYDYMQNRYLILCNHSYDNNNNNGRQLWTFCHELGHILCRHLEMSAYQKLSENSIAPQRNSLYEDEADYFAANLIAPFPLFQFFNIQTASDIRRTFGLSKEASTYRMQEYSRWLRQHTKTAIENDLIRLFRKQLPHG